MLSALRPFSFVLVASSLALACGGGKVIHVNGIEVYEKHWNKAITGLAPRAAYDLQCPQAQLLFTLFQKTGREPTEVGVDGCGKRAVYVRPNSRVGGYTAISDTWVMNTVSEPAAPGAPPAGAAPTSQGNDGMNL
jgi:hypothetical protein